MHAFSYARALAWTALMGNLMSAKGESTALANPGIFEVDALFPRNETYTPQALMPIVFALQNPLLASPLSASISWDLWEGNNFSSPGSVTRGGLDLDTMDFTSNETFLVTRIVNTFAYPEGFWTLYWTLVVSNCSEPDKSTTQYINVNGTTVFTVSKSGQAPDLVAATFPAMCGTADAYTFNATSFGDSCGVLGSRPTPNPCAAAINASAASSINAAATATACSPPARSLNPNVTCPTGNSAASLTDAVGRSCIAVAVTVFILLATLTALI